MDANLRNKDNSIPLPDGKAGVKGLKLKICGMKFPENIGQVAALQPDYMGFIFFENSPRNFDTEIPQLNEGIIKTGVFVNASAEFILTQARKHKLQAIQLHGQESAELCAVLKAEGLEVIKVFSVKDSFDFNILQPYEGKVDFFLFDTKGKAEGGNGVTFDWEILKKYPSETPFFLSGGIGLQEVSRLKDLQFPKTFYGIDVNSRFETKPGYKDLENLKELRTIIPQG